MSRTNLKPASWEPTINSVKGLKAALAGGKEFTVTDMTSPWNGATTTARELKEQGITSAQIRYGKRLEKVWYGAL